eukprot:748404-Hanusia_phi.AAC.1
MEFLNWSSADRLILMAKRSSRGASGLGGGGGRRGTRIDVEKKRSGGIEGARRREGAKSQREVKRGQNRDAEGNREGQGTRNSNCRSFSSSPFSHLPPNVAVKLRQDHLLEVVRRQLPVLVQQRPSHRQHVEVFLRQPGRMRQVQRSILVQVQPLCEYQAPALRC